jgi:succinate dehydrogenase / fumarate reductase, flavoprotein subunit
VPTNLYGEVVMMRDSNPEAIVPGVMAIGEAACVSVHGANRLGSNSLLDIIVFGRAAAHRVTETVRPGESHAPIPEEATDRAIARLDRIRWSGGGTKPGAIRLAMQRTMQRHCAVFRDGPLLEEGLRKLDEVIEMMRADLSVTDRSMIFNTDLGEMLELDNMLAQASVSLHSAIGRTESRGAHVERSVTLRSECIISMTSSSLRKPSSSSGPSRKTAQWRCMVRCIASRIAPGLVPPLDCPGRFSAARRRKLAQAHPLLAR